MHVKLYPMSVTQMEARLAGASTIDGLQLTEEIMPTIVLRMSCGALRQGASPRWCEPRLMVIGEPPVAVGSIAFMHEPVDRRVEIGYGVAAPHAGKGVATEGVRLLARQALAQPEVGEVYAETAIGNLASRRVLEKVGFRHIRQRDSEHDGRVDCWLLRDRPRRAEND